MIHATVHIAGPIDENGQFCSRCGLKIRSGRAFKFITGYKRGSRIGVYPYGHGERYTYVVDYPTKRKIGWRDHQTFGRFEEVECGNPTRADRGEVFEENCGG